MTKYSFDNVQEVQSNWFKFNEVGDKIIGTLVGKRKQAGSDGFPDQMVYELKNDDGLWNVGISMNKPGTIQRLNACKMGEIVGIVFEAEGEPAKKGFHPAKFLKVLTKGMDPDYDATDGMEEVQPEVTMDDLNF